MEWNPETLQFLSQSFLDTLSPQPEPRRRAEKDLADTPNYGLAVLRLVAEPSVDEQIRQCAALNFKNHLKNRWVPSSATPVIPDGEKEQIKSLIVPLMLSATPKIQAQLSEAVAVIGNHEELFAGDEILQQNIIPNVMLRDEDEELFKMNYVEFIRRDMEEGGELRRIACELVKGISGKNKEKISAQIHHCLAVFAENPAANWKYKECAIYLVVSLATKDGGSVFSTDLVDVESFFRSVIVPELQCEDVDSSFPMLKASALKFFTMFCALIPKHVVVPLLGDVVRFLGSDVYVVHSYAAICIEKLLLVKDNGVQEQARYTSMDIGPIRGYLITNLLDALKKPASEENEYIMRCIMRVLQTADISRELASFCIPWLITVLKRVCENHPYKTHPVFDYFLFEAVATLVRRACEKNPCLGPKFETCLFPIIEMILADQLTKLFPYAFQLLAELVDIYTPPFPAAYMLMFDMLLLPPDLWEISVNVPGLVRLLQSFLQQAPNEVNTKGRLRHVVLGMINELVSSPTTEEEGFHILNMVIQKYGYDVIAEYMSHTWASLSNRLQNGTTTSTLVRCLIIFMSLFLVKHGTQTLVDLINSVQANSLHVILGEVWIPNLKTITGCTEVKLSAVASIKLLCESPLLLDPAAEELWGKLLDAIVTLLTLPQEKGVQNGGGKQELLCDPLKEIEDPKHFLVAFPENISPEFGGRFPLVIMRYLSPPNQTALVNLCNSYNITIV